MEGSHNLVIAGRFFFSSSQFVKADPSSFQRPVRVNCYPRLGEERSHHGGDREDHRLVPGCGEFSSRFPVLIIESTSSPECCTYFPLPLPRFQFLP
jgi:hypothetical protein